MPYNQKYAQLQATTLAGAGSAIGDTSLVLASFQSIDGVNLAMTDFGDIAYGTIEPNNGAFEEQMSFTGITQNANGTATLTGVKRVLMLNPHTETAGLAKAHSGGVKFVISNTSAFQQNIIDYINDIAIAGAPDSSTSVKGLVKMSVAPAVSTSPIAVGTNDVRVPTTAQISYIPTSDQKAALAGTGTPSAANKYMTADYLTTILASAASASESAKVFKCGITTYNTLTAVTATVTIAHGLGKAPKRVQLNTIWSYPNYVNNCFGSVDANGNKSISQVRFTADSTNLGHAVNSTSYAINMGYYVASTYTEANRAVVTYDATNIYIAWVGINGIGSNSELQHVLWQAEA